MSGERKRIEGLDGLRAIALLSVVFFHLETKPWIPGGFVGVDLFFVLSGFLITGLLLDELDRRQTIDLTAFYLRRARRLLPAFAAMLLGVLSVSLLVLDPDARAYPTLEELNASVLLAVLYGFNWLVAFDLPYMRAIAHVWSLSIEEQFYLVWPVALIFLTRHAGSEAAIRRVVVLGILLSLSIPFWDTDWGWNRLYYGSDYRASGLLLGCLVALARRDPELRQSLTEPSVLGPVAAASCAFLVFVAATTAPDQPYLYLGGFLCIGLASAAILLFVVEAAPGHPVVRFLQHRTLVWIGRRSYAGYLFHMPLVIWTRRLDVPLFDQMVLVLGLTFLLVEASWRWIERPMLEGRAGTAPQAGER
ncbi:MAG: acyltransferase [bacterium]|nr:acyltransferase [bacterium]